MTTALQRRKPVASFELLRGDVQVRQRDQYVIEVQGAQRTAPGALNPSGYSELTARVAALRTDVGRGAKSSAAPNF